MIRREPNKDSYLVAPESQVVWMLSGNSGNLGEKRQLARMSSRSRLVPPLPHNCCGLGKKKDSGQLENTHYLPHHSDLSEIETWEKNSDQNCGLWQLSHLLTTYQKDHQDLRKHLVAYYFKSVDKFDEKFRYNSNPQNILWENKNQRKSENLVNHSKICSKGKCWRIWLVAKLFSYCHCEKTESAATWSFICN